MKKVKKILTVIAVAGNLLFVLWITYNGAHEGFKRDHISGMIFVNLLRIKNKQTTPQIKILIR